MEQRIFRVTLLILIGMTILTGCWDQRLLRDHSLILSIGYDVAGEEGIVKTVTFPALTSGGSEGKQTSSPNNNQVLSMSGDTVKDAEKHMDQRIPEKFDRSKSRVIFFGEELATDGIFSTLDSVYRDLRGPLNANVGVFAGEASEALSVTSEEGLLASDIYDQLLNSAEEAGITLNHDVQTACPILLTEGKDLVLPYLSLVDENKVTVEGLALFHGDQMTGTLNIKESSMFLMLSDQVTRNTSINLKVTDDHEDYIKNFVNIAIRNTKRNINLDVQDDHVRVNLDLSVDVEIDEYAHDHLYDQRVIEQLTKDIERVLGQLAEVTITNMQEANNDSLGIGEKVRAHHPSTWEAIEWSKVYPEIEIKPTFDIHIIRHGIMN